jgi:hypothetical protein
MQPSPSQAMSLALLLSAGWMEEDGRFALHRQITPVLEKAHTPLKSEQLTQQAIRTPRQQATHGPLIQLRPIAISLHSRLTPLNQLTLLLHLPATKGLALLSARWMLVAGALALLQ